MRGWTQDAVERAQAKYKIRGSEVTVLPVMKRINIPRSEPKPLTEMKQILKFMQVVFVTEYKFLEDRKFRFDIAMPDIKLAIEYEGLMATKSRHTTVTGYSQDTEKYNQAMIAGWRVLRYTQLTYNQFLGDLNKVL